MTDLAPFHVAARSMAEAIAALPRGTRWFLDADTDADGVCAAAVASAALRRLGHRVHVRPSRDKAAGHYEQVLAQEHVDAWMFLDKGSSHEALLAAAGKPCFLVDHHNVAGAPAGGLMTLNPRLCGLDGSRDASASTTAALLAFALFGDHALRWGPHALAGAIGDWQHRPDWKGWNAQLLARCRQAGHVVVRDQPLLVGVDLAGAVAARRPPIPALATRAAAALWLEGLDVEPTAEVEDLDAAEHTRLASALALAHLEAGHGRTALDGLVGPTDHHAALGTSLRHVFRIVDACGRQGRAATGIAFLLGDAGARAEGQALFTAYKDALVTALDRLAGDGTEARQAVQHAWIEDARFTGMAAGIGMLHTVPDKRLPLCILATREDGLVQVSTRGLEPHVAAGLDLGAAVQEAAAHVGEEGGGHPVAAGTVLPAEAVDAFLTALDAALETQGFLEAP